MFANHIIEPTNSLWISPIVLVRKNAWWKCYVLHRYACCKSKQHPFPNISNCLDFLGGCKYFSTLDLSSGYWQVELKDAAKPKTGFVTRIRTIFQFNVLPLTPTSPLNLWCIEAIDFEGIAMRMMFSLLRYNNLPYELFDKPWKSWLPYFSTYKYL